ncbi:FitA-like ribbon-helix-helix domain-containing protein [Flexivirga oryzae]|uniref:Plasmid stability protein n=1 Tax=Flexivirga oryzae TaxID=1794944 RepID=A0A839N881_9MICO|nr:hypothetical protein [Flexivirga oryzae]MBB2890862.1 plasmid stability protein [Flexivirga oryzae]
MTVLRIRNVPDELHVQLKVRAAREGITLSELVLNELRRAASVPSAAELRQRFSGREIRSYNGETAAESIRAERDACR